MKNLHKGIPFGYSVLLSFPRVLVISALSLPALSSSVPVISDLLAAFRASDLVGFFRITVLKYTV